MRAAGAEPLDPYVGSKVPWRCRCTSCGREVTPRLNNVLNGSRPCAYCTGNRVDPEDAATAMRDAGLEPLGPYPGALKQWRCRCTRCGLEVNPLYASIQQGGKGCVYCVGNRVTSEVAVKVMRTADLEPIEPYVGGKVPWRCRCLKCGVEVTPAYSDVASGQGGCIHCGARRRGLKRRTPEEAARAVMLEADLEPLDPYIGANDPWRCRCLKCGREVTSKLGSVQYQGVSCAYCSGRRVEPEEAATLMRQRGIEPLEPYPGSNNPWLCRCMTCGREVTPTYSSVAGGNGPCAYCAGQKVDVAEAIAFLAFEGLEVLEPYPGTNKPWLCRCAACGNSVRPRLTDVRNGHQGCGYCSSASFLGTPAHLYLIAHVELAAVKVGIARKGSKRVSQWKDRGWETVGIWHFDDGAQVVAIENEILRWWRTDLDAPLAFDREDLSPLGGHTETAPLWAVDLDETLVRIEKAIASL